MTTRYTARSPVGYVIRTAEPTVAAALSRQGYRVSAVSSKEDFNDGG